MQGPVGPRVSKEDFMHALGLNPHEPQHEQYYRAMRDEAILVYNHMNQDTSYLLDSVRNDPSTRPPFFWHHIRPESQRWGILETWRNSGPLTRPLFDRGMTNGEYGPNWVAAWLLYSVFRSRDVRNNRNRRKGDVNGNHEGNGNGVNDQVTSKKTKGDTAATATATSGSDSVAEVETGTATAIESSTTKKGYYDPVRNGTV